MSYFKNTDHIYSYRSFLAYTEQRLAEGKSTNEETAAEYLHYTKLNLQRMQRVYKQLAIPTAASTIVAALPPQTWWVITEGWCGDGAQILPIMQRLAEQNSDIQLQILLRDQNPQIMDRYLSNGSRSIPIVIATTKQHELWVWGPRPAGARELMRQYQANKEAIPFDEFEISLQQWYNADKGAQTIAEVLAAIKGT